MGPLGCNGSDLPALQPSQAFASLLVERLGRKERLCANSPWCSHDAGWQRQLAPMLRQVPAEYKAGRGEPHQWSPYLLLSSHPIRLACAGVKQSLSSRPHKPPTERDTLKPFPRGL